MSQEVAPKMQHWGDGFLDRGTTGKPGAEPIAEAHNGRKELTPASSLLTHVHCGNPLPHLSCVRARTHPCNKKELAKTENIKPPPTTF